MFKMIRRINKENYSEYLVYFGSHCIASNDVDPNRTTEWKLCVKLPHYQETIIQQMLTHLYHSIVSLKGLHAWPKS